MGHKLNQAVILCGGLGTRLLPYTRKIPKPMINCNGKPFLWYVLDQLNSQGVNNFCLLTGYLSYKIKFFFGDGSKFGWDISYSEGPIEWTTGRRIWEAKDILHKNFLLLYSDNFSLVNINNLYMAYKRNMKPITLSLCKKKNGNVEIEDNGQTIKYNNERKGPNSNYVEIGYMLLEKMKIISDLEKKKDDFSTLLTTYSKQNLLSFYEHNDNYYSISDPERWKIATDYVSPKKIILIDRDGVINKKSTRGRYVSNWSEFEWIDSTVQTMEKLSKIGFEFIVITNQAGINRGMLSKHDLEDIHKNMKNFLLNLGINIKQIYYCPHHWDEKCFCRKPNPGLFFKASRDWLFRLDKTIFIGDDIRDMEASINAGCKGIYIGKNKDLDYSTKKNVIKCCNELNEVFDVIKNFFGE